VVQIQKNGRDLGLSIRGIGAGVDIGFEKLGIFVKSIVKNGLVDADGKINAGDQILSVDGINLVGVTQAFASSALKNTGDVVNFKVGREKRSISESSKAIGFEDDAEGISSTKDICIKPNTVSSPPSKEDFSPRIEKCALKSDSIKLEEKVSSKEVENEKMNFEIGAVTSAEIDTSSVDLKPFCCGINRKYHDLQVQHSKANEEIDRLKMRIGQLEKEHKAKVDMFTAHIGSLRKACRHIEEQIVVEDVNLDCRRTLNSALELSKSLSLLQYNLEGSAFSCSTTEDMGHEILNSSHAKDKLKVVRRASITRRTGRGKLGNDNSDFTSSLKSFTVVSDQIASPFSKRSTEDLSLEEKLPPMNVLQ